MVVSLAFCCNSGKVGDCSYQHRANPDTSTVKYLLFGKHALGDSTDAPSDFVYLLADNIKACPGTNQINLTAEC